MLDKLADKIDARRAKLKLERRQAAYRSYVETGSCTPGLSAQMAGFLFIPLYSLVLIFRCLVPAR